MLTRIEIDGFKTFSSFSIDLMPFTAIVGPNASGKSNLFDAVRLIAELANHDVRSAMLNMRGEPDELLRKTSSNSAREMRFAVEVLLKPEGRDQFGTRFTLKSQRIRYEVSIGFKAGSSGDIINIHVIEERCTPIKKQDDRADFLNREHGIKYRGNLGPFLTTEIDEGGARSFRIRQDGPNKAGKAVRLPAAEASRTALSTIASAEFPHLYALKEFLSQPRFLEISPREARRENDRFLPRDLLPDASNLAAVVARIRDETSTTDQPEGVLVDISADLARLIPSTRRVRSVTSADQKEYSYEIEMAEGLTFSSRVISDGTLRLLALITVLNDPRRSGLLCFEEPENGIHEGRVGALVDLIRGATEDFAEDYFQVLTNTHSPAVMEALKDTEIVAADIVREVNEQPSERKTRMRRRPQRVGDLVDAGSTLTRFEIEKLLRRSVDAA
jgi:predicted ATPase